MIMIKSGTVNLTDGRTNAFTYGNTHTEASLGVSLLPGSAYERAEMHRWRTRNAQRVSVRSSGLRRQTGAIRILTAAVHVDRTNLTRAMPPYGVTMRRLADIIKSGCYYDVYFI